jgi:2',3'-cyclic-nucleotide 2'-phosphodiesterase (5'-nucleotidase family)
MKLKYFLIATFLFCFLSCEKSTFHNTKITAKNITIDSSFTSKETIKSLIYPYKEKIQKDMEEVLCYSPKNYVKTDGNLQSTVGNLMADMCFEIANPLYKKQTKNSIDFVMFNHGGIRAIIPKGNITRAHAFKIMPFENQLVVATLSGVKIQELVRFFIEKKTAHPLSKQVKLILKENDFSLKINGEAFDKHKNYHVLTSDYLLNGGDHMNFFNNPEKLVDINVKIRDAIIQYFTKVDTLKATLDNRVKL